MRDKIVCPFFTFEEKDMNEITSEYRNKKYQTSGVVRILDYRQAVFYWDKGVEPLDIYLSRDFQTKKPKIVFVFSREDTKELYDEWMKSKEEQQ